MKYDKVEDYIHVEKNLIPKDVCDYIISVIEIQKWSPHFWYNPLQNKMTSEETMELDILASNKEMQDLLTPFIIRAGAAYNSKYAYLDTTRTEQIMNKFCNIRFNRYRPGQIMRKHHDHIHSIFDGQEKGIPVLSFVGNLNEDYEGGELVFFDGETKVKLGTGDICMFPSCFMYPHQVYEVTKNQRYSFVTWGW